MSITVRVRDFQSIEDATVVIEGLTVLTGTNNAGKSALFRAVRGAFTNAPGHAFVRTGKPHCTVDLEFEDGQTLTWKKGKGVNTYIVNGKVYDKVDRGVPPEVRIFGVEPIQVGDKELWPQIASQVTGIVFLLNESGSTIAEAVADVERVRQLTSALKSSESDRKAVRADIKVRTETASSLAEQRTWFAGLDLAVERSEELTKRHDTAERLEKALDNLERLVVRHRAAVADVASLRGLEEVDKHIPSEEKVGDCLRQTQELQTLRSLKDRWISTKDVAESLQGLEEVGALVPSEERVAFAGRFRQGIGITVELVARYERTLKEFRRAEEAHSALSGVSLDDDLVDRIQKFGKGVQMARLLASRRVRACAEIREVDAEIAACELQRQQLETALVRLLGAVPECPTCGQEVHT